ncbi:MAG: hypothetical protein ABEL76_15860 [Bradymonadaceae bacterium]
MLTETCSSHPDVLDEPAPQVRFSEFGDSALIFELLFFFDCRKVAQPAKIVGELNFDIWDALEEANVEIPFPQRDLHLRTDETRGSPEGAPHFTIAADGN